MVTRTFMFFSESYTNCLIFSPSSSLFSEGETFKLLTEVAFAMTE